MRRVAALAVLAAPVATSVAAQSVADHALAASLRSAGTTALSTADALIVVQIVAIIALVANAVQAVTAAIRASTEACLSTLSLHQTQKTHRND